MSGTKTLQQKLLEAPIVSSLSNLCLALINSAGSIVKMQESQIADSLAAKKVHAIYIADLDNPPYSGFFFVNSNTKGTRPTTGYWDYGLIISISDSIDSPKTGIQIWISYGMNVAIRAKSSAAAPWKDWEIKF